MKRRVFKNTPLELAVLKWALNREKEDAKLRKFVKKYLRRRKQRKGR